MQATATAHLRCFGIVYADSIPVPGGMVAVSLAVAFLSPLRPRAIGRDKDLILRRPRVLSGAGPACRPPGLDARGPPGVNLGSDFLPIPALAVAH
jgi:hypothetical protein